MGYTEREVLQFVEENDVKFVKLMFCDVFGNLKSISVISNKLTGIFKNGYSFDASHMDGFMGVNDMDLTLRPLLDTLSLLPWRPQHGRVMRLFCEIYRANGEPFEGDGRHYLSRAVEKAKQAGLDFQIGTSCEFYVFELDQKGMPTKLPHDNAGCCDAAPADRGENLRRDICMALEQMEVYPHSSRHEAGPGQNEIDFISASPINAADNLVTFKNTVKSVSERDGLYASFMPKPLPDRSGSSLQITISCTHNGRDVFSSKDGSLSLLADRMIGGITDCLPAMTMFFNGITNSYSRLQAIDSMKKVCWSSRNINVPLRLKKGGLVIRTPDNTCNPYFAIGLIINACLDGIKRALNAPKPIESYDGIDGADIPEDLSAAADAAENSGFIKESFDERTLKYMLEKKRLMCEEFEQAQNKEIYETVKYFFAL